MVNKYSTKGVDEWAARRRFDRFNGNQISYLIHSFGQSIDKLTIEDGQRIENLIMKELPSELKSEIAVFNWIKGKYYITVIKKEQRP